MQIVNDAHVTHVQSVYCDCNMLTDNVSHPFWLAYIVLQASYALFQGLKKSLRKRQKSHLKFWNPSQTSVGGNFKIGFTL